MRRRHLLGLTARERVGTYGDRLGADGTDSSSADFGTEDRALATGAAIGPEADLSAFDWSVAGPNAAVDTGERSLGICNRGDYDDGGSWGVQRIPAESGRVSDPTVDLVPR